MKERFRPGAWPEGQTILSSPESLDRAVAGQRRYRETGGVPSGA